MVPPYNAFASSKTLGNDSSSSPHLTLFPLLFLSSLSLPSPLSSPLEGVPVEHVPAVPGTLSSHNDLSYQSPMISISARLFVRAVYCVRRHCKAQVSTLSESSVVELDCPAPQPSQWVVVVWASSMVVDVHGAWSVETGT